MIYQLIKVKNHIWKGMTLKCCLGRLRFNNKKIFEFSFTLVVQTTNSRFRDQNYSNV